MPVKIDIVSKPKKELGDGLPTRRVAVKQNPLSLYWLLIAVAGWGKTEWFASYPDSIILACESGYKLIPDNSKAMVLVIDCFDFKGAEKESWKDGDGYMHMSFIQAVELLEKTDRFKFVTIDTVDTLIKMITDFMSMVKKVEHIEEIGAYGKGFDLGQNSPFRKIINRLVKTGRGIGFITHQEIAEKQFKNGPRAKKETTLPNGIRKLIVPMVSIVIHGETGKKNKLTKKRDRIGVTEGGDEMIAKNRGGLLPGKFIIPMDQDVKWKMIEGFFTNPKTVAQAEAAYEKLYEE